MYCTMYILCMSLLRRHAHMGFYRWWYLRKQMHQLHKKWAKSKIGVLFCFKAAGSRTLQNLVKKIIHAFSTFCFLHTWIDSKLKIVSQKVLTVYLCRLLVKISGTSLARPCFHFWILPTWKVEEKMCKPWCVNWFGHLKFCSLANRIPYT